MAQVVMDNQSAPSTPASGAAAGYFDTTLKRWSSINADGSVTNYPALVQAASVADVTGAYASDTYLAGSAVTIPTAGDWTVGETYVCTFDLTKTAAGTATLVLTLRMGTLGTVADAAILTLTFGAGTAAVDRGVFDVMVTFRTVGSGTSAVVQGLARCTHELAATGLISTGASGSGTIVGASAGFNSTTQTKIGLSVNGGTSFSGTNTIVQARVTK
jgi:hypothetical protein